MIDINLLPYEKRTPKALIRLIIIFAAFCLVMLILAVIYTIHLGHDVQQAEQQESQWQARSEVKKTLKQTNAKASKNALSQSETVMNVKASRIPLYDTLLLFQHQLPSGGTIQQLSFDSSGNMSVTCGLVSYSDMQQFIARLRKSAFNNVELTQITNGQAQAGSNASSSSKYQVSLTLVSQANQQGGQ